MKWIMADKVLTVTIYDEEHEDHLQKRMTVEDILDSFTDEGCPTIYSNPEKDAEQLHKIMHVKAKPERILMVLTASEEE